MKIASVFNFLESHYAIYRRIPRCVILLSFSNLDTFFSTTDVEVVRPICLKIKLDFTPLEHMDAWKHFGWLSHHNKKLVALLIHLCRFESVKLRLIFRYKFIAYGTKVMVIRMVNEAHIWVIQALYQSFFGSGFTFMQTLWWICFVEEVGLTSASIDPAEQSIPPNKSLISCEAAKVHRIDILMEGFIIEVINIV